MAHPTFAGVNAHTLLVGIALILAVLGLIFSSFAALAVAVILVTIAELI